MLIRIDFESEVPIYLQLKNQILEGIALGSMKPGEALPSVRQMAADLGINLHTVNKTYGMLKQDGFLLIHRQKGVVVNPQEAGLIDPLLLEKLKSELRPLAAEAFCRGLNKEAFQQLCSDIYADFHNSNMKGVNGI